MSKEFDVHYGQKEFEAVESGIEAIEAVLTGKDITGSFIYQFLGIHSPLDEDR